MNYFKTRKKYMLNNIFNMTNNSQECVVAIIFNKKIAEYELYKFQSNQYTKTTLGKNDWADKKYLEDLSWDELMDITRSLKKVELANFDNWVKNASDSYKYKILKNIYNAIF